MCLLTATGTPLAGRTTFSHLSHPFTAITWSSIPHCGGMIGASSRLGQPLLLTCSTSHRLHQDPQRQDHIEDASFVWGMGTRATTEGICRKDGNKFAVAAIGPR